MAAPLHRDDEAPDAQGRALRAPPTADASAKTARSRRGELEAQQKRYMDERFGRDRPMTRKSPG